MSNLVSYVDTSGRSSVRYRHGADPAIKAICQMTSWRWLTITYTHRCFWPIYRPIRCWYGGAYYT